MAISALSRQFRAETPYTVNFDFDSDDLDAQAMEKLDIQASWIIDHPNVKFRVYGHTDRVGNIAYNADLGLRRAQRVVAYLISRGIGEERLEAVSSFGEDLPVVLTEAPERLNRRTLTDVIGFIELPDSERDGVGPGPLVRLDPRDVPAFDEVQDQTSSEMTAEIDTSPTQDGGGDQTGGTSENTSKGGQNPNSGRGNGDDGGDPGKSSGKNNGGDETA